MVKEVFVDAGFWIALFSPTDEHHTESRSIWQEAAGNQWPAVTTNWTLDEALTFLSCRLRRHDRTVEAMEFVSRLCEIVHVEDAQLEGRGLEIFRSRSDKRWSLVDCANFACIERRQCELALAFDINFQQASVEFGFNHWMPQ